MEKALIEKVRLNEIIYNYKLPTYRNQSAKRAAWDRIGKELETTGSIAKARWDNLRRCYSNARSRRRETECKQAWKYEEEMSFLLPFIQERVSKGYASAFVDLSSKAEEFMVDGYSEDTAEETTNMKFEREDMTFDGEPEVDITEKYDYSNESDLEADNSFYEKMASERFGQHHSSAKERNLNDVGFNINMLNDNSISATFDHTDLFFLSMSKMTKQLPKTDQSRIKLELSKLVLIAEMKNNESKN